MAVSQLGTISVHSHGWRAQARMGGIRINGPTRLHKREADADLEQARAAQTEEQYRDILRCLQLQKATQLTTRTWQDKCRKAISQLGTIIRNTNGWRVAAAPTGRVIYGPCRARKADAEADLKQAREAESREEYREIIRQLQETVQRQLKSDRAIRRKAKAKAKAMGDGWQRRLIRIGNIRRCSTHSASTGRLIGWQVTAAPTGRLIRGPVRRSKRKACVDLEKARRAQTWEEYQDIIRQMRKPRMEVWDTVMHWGNGWRVTAAPLGYLIHGPYRAYKSDADADLKRVRIAKTLKEYRSILLQLTEEDAQLRKRACSEACVPMRGCRVSQPASGTQQLTESRLKGDEIKEAASWTEKTQESQIHSQKRQVEAGGRWLE